MAENVLRLDDITMQFGGVVAVNNLSLEVNRGEIVALIGPNGAGKTTAFNCITGVYEPTNGMVAHRGKPPARPHEAALCRRERGKVPVRPHPRPDAGPDHAPGHRPDFSEHPPV
jgi:branched-chain amino acid transport system ATP-binding protein